MPPRFLTRSTSKRTLIIDQEKSPFIYGGYTVYVLNCHVLYMYSLFQSLFINANNVIPKHSKYGGIRFPFYNAIN